MNQESLKLIGLALVTLGIIFGVLGKLFVKTRLFIFRDSSMLKQFITGFILMIIGVVFLYLSGAI
ncbi:MULTISPECIES: hypothetical protein [Vagococcus]|uniref:Uncharacterized protein n=1 Tax=Vagococcus fluvialis bH819 TaxID=1255619 RepID=A0A1X6WP90_9ENTE|nr:MULTISPECIES: hypothetical protein [Vagococcus]SLM86042.1 hypothetical protein FM121_08140 [Vagococcus fluvialis bH819]HCM88828.1 hypothetical protein [Vagococcus sp.]